MVLQVWREWGGGGEGREMRVRVFNILACTR